MDMLDHLAGIVLTRLVWTSIQAALLIGAIYLLGRLLPRLSAAMRCMLWWLVGTQLLLGLCWSAPLELPLLSPPAVSTPAEVGPQSITFVVTPMTTPAAIAHRSLSRKASTPLSWRTGMAMLWLAALLVQLTLATRQWWQARRVLRESRPLHDGPLLALCTRQARMLGLHACPQLRVSELIVSPQVIGLWRPTVLLPAGDALSVDEAAMAMAHELVHLRRGDLWLGWVPAIAQRLFFFHPLVAWAMREYALNRESACDAQVLQQDHAAPQDYGRLLLRLGVAHPMHAGLAGASPSFHNLKRRLTMLQQTVNHPQSRTRGWLLVALIALVGVLPYRVTATSSTGHTNDAQAAAAHAASPVPPLPPLPPAPPPPVMPPPPPPPIPPVPPAPPPHGSGFSAHHLDVDIHADARDGFALFDGDSVTVNGSERDLVAAKQLQKGNAPMLWFRRGDKAYLIRDASYIQHARAAYAPVTELAKQQGELGGRQGRLGGQQGALGAQQGVLGTRQAQLASQQAMLAARSSQHEGAAKLEAAQAQLEASQGELGRQQDELGRQQDALGKQQQVLGAQQEILGKREQLINEQANQQVSKLLDEAIAKGIAQPAGAR